MLELQKVYNTLKKKELEDYEALNAFMTLSLSIKCLDSLAGKDVL